MKIMIIGATSAIAAGVARIYAEEGAELFLVARDATRLEAAAKDLLVRGAKTVETRVADLSDRTNDAALVAAAGSPDVVLIAHGLLPDQLAIDHDAVAQTRAFDLNATSVIALVARVADAVAPGGVIAVIGSVAGDRGRRSNYVYGAAKAAVHAYCEGLRGRLAASSIAVLLIKPGWVDTPMTAGLKKNPLFASAPQVARGIHAAIRARRATVYLPGYWRWISLVVRLLPARLVKF
jgi:decaprenylphospho-beta-D-erythro-pentofuranosid-2-ulose 2-reductase